MNRENMHVILLCGGRDFADVAFLRNLLDAYLFMYGPDIMFVSGAARGADLIGEGWARDRQQIYVGVPAEWDKYGHSAGTKRNGEMLKLIKPTVVVAMRGQRGTFNMAMQAEKAGIPVHKWGWDT